MVSDCPRILLLTPAFPPDAGGIERTAAELAGGLSDYTIKVLTSRPTAQRGMVMPSGVDVHWARNSPPYGRRATLDLSRLAVRIGAPFDPDLVLALHIRLMPAARALRRVCGSRSLLVVHAKEMPEQPALARAGMHWADQVVCVSRFSRELALDVGADPQRLETINPGVSVPEAVPPRLADRPWPPTVVTVARLDDWHKGHETALEALARLRPKVPGVRWVMVGEGERMPELRRLASARGLGDCVEWTGGVDDGELHRLLLGARAFCLLSREPPGGGAGEGFGIAFVEAGAHGLPVIAGRIPGVADAVSDGRAGLLVDPNDPQGAADALEGVLTDPGFAQQLADGGRERAAKLSWSNVVESYRQVIDEVLCRDRHDRPCHGLRWALDLLRGPSALR